MTATRRGGASGLPRMNTAQVITPSARTAVIPATSRPLLLDTDGGAASGSAGVQSLFEVEELDFHVRHVLHAARRDLF